MELYLNNEQSLSDVLKDARDGDIIRVFDSWSSDILAIYRFLYTTYIRTFFIMSIFLFFLLLTVVNCC